LRSAEPDFEALIEACFQHPYDEQVYQRFYVVFRPYLTAMLVSMSSGSSSLAFTLVQDALQSAFFKFVQIFRTGQRPQISSMAYFVALTKNCLIDEIRHYQRYVPIDEFFELEFTPSQSDEEHQTQLRIAFIQAMMQLDRRCQFILESYYIRGMNAQELARRLKIQPRSVHMAVKRCREELRAILNGES
jgi:RNA polymerase sigma factor (sigma-70 family)